MARNGKKRLENYIRDSKKVLNLLEKELTDL